MSEPMRKADFKTGAGKGDHERPVNRKVFRDNMEKIKKHGNRGTAVFSKGAKTTYKYS